VTTTTVATVVLARRERQVLEGVAAGDALDVIARRLVIEVGTARSYLKLARYKLYGVSDSVFAVALGYATEAITRPPLLDPKSLCLPREQNAVVPLIAQGMAAAQMATLLDRPVNTVRADCREVLKTLHARNRPHLVTRVWQYQCLTADQVIAWLP